ncbi:MAG TPA: hypothetical protein VFE58_16720 [Tepidisphaeraceae bacterium]|jgi:hypothetical protein|nr:hypothetical protein [Tepidisphaeraceae bacterium]
MKTFVNQSIWAIMAVMMAGCASNSGVKSGEMAKGKEYLMQSGGHSVLKLTGPMDSQGKSQDGSLTISLKNDVEIWLVSGVGTIGEAEGRIGETMKGEFKDFKPASTKEVMIAGSSAKELVGPGNEADDGDAGEADVIVFKVGGRVFVACTHGEELKPGAREGMMRLVKTAQGV